LGISKPAPTCYRTTNWSSINDALRRRGSLLVCKRSVSLH